MQGREAWRLVVMTRSVLKEFVWIIRTALQRNVRRGALRITANEASKLSALPDGVGPKGLLPTLLATDDEVVDGLGINIVIGIILFLVAGLLYLLSSR